MCKCGVSKCCVKPYQFFFRRKNWIEYWINVKFSINLTATYSKKWMWDFFSLEFRNRKLGLRVIHKCVLCMTNLDIYINAGIRERKRKREREKEREREVYRFFTLFFFSLLFEFYFLNSFSSIVFPPLPLFHSPPLSLSFSLVCLPAITLFSLVALLFPLFFFHPLYKSTNPFFFLLLLICISCNYFPTGSPSFSIWRFFKYQISAHKTIHSILDAIHSNGSPKVSVYWRIALRPYGTNVPMLRSF